MFSSFRNRKDARSDALYVLFPCLRVQHETSSIGSTCTDNTSNGSESHPNRKKHRRPKKKIPKVAKTLYKFAWVFNFSLMMVWPFWTTGNFFFQDATLRKITHSHYSDASLIIIWKKGSCRCSRLSEAIGSRSISVWKKEISNCCSAIPIRT